MSKKLILGLQHTLAMFTATVLIPLIMGFDIPTALFMAGIGTLVFHLLTGGKIPIFLGSSGSFVGGILIIKNLYGLNYAYGAIAASGVVYLVAALIAKFVGYKNFVKVFPTIVVAPIVMLIGITLSPVAVGMAQKGWTLAIITMAAVVIIGIYAKGFFKLIPIIGGIVVGYVAGIITGVVKFKPILDAAWFELPKFGTPAFSWAAIAIMAPIALVTIMEHIGELSANGDITGNNWFEKLGLHRTLAANSMTFILAGLIGAPPNTTYGENNATLALTKQFNPRIIQIAAVFAIILSFSGKFAAFINTIPAPVMGGVSFILFGTLVCIGLQQLISRAVDLHNMRNSIVVLVTLFVGISSITAKNVISVTITDNISFSGLSLAAIIAVLLNLILNVIFKKKETINQ
jgi:uracil permease